VEKRLLPQRRCGVPKPIKTAPKAAGKGMRPGDWMCPACGNHNYAVPWMVVDEWMGWKK